MAPAGAPAKVFLSRYLRGEALSGVSWSVRAGPVTPERLCLDTLIPVQKGPFFFFFLPVSLNSLPHGLHNTGARAFLHAAWCLWCSDLFESPPHTKACSAPGPGGGRVQTTLTQTPPEQAEALLCPLLSFYSENPLCPVFLSPLRPSCAHNQVSLCSCRSPFPDVSECSPPPCLPSAVLTLSANTLFLLDTVPGSKPCSNGCSTCLSHSN